MSKKGEILANIAEYIDGVQFRKRLFGVRITDVYDAMQEMDAMYQDVMERYSQSLNEGYKNREVAIFRNEKRLKELTGKVDSLLGIKKKEQRRIQELEEKLKNASINRVQFRNQTDMMLESISDTQKCKEEILNKAREQAARILEEAERQGQKIRQRNLSPLLQEREIYQDGIDKLRQTKEKAEDNLHLIQIDLCNLKDTLTALRKGMKQTETDIHQEEIECKKEDLEDKVQVG